LPRPTEATDGLLRASAWPERCKNDTFWAQNGTIQHLFVRGMARKGSRTAPKRSGLTGPQAILLRPLGSCGRGLRRRPGPATKPAGEPRRAPFGRLRAGPSIPRLRDSPGLHSGQAPRRAGQAPRPARDGPLDRLGTGGAGSGGESPPVAIQGTALLTIVTALRSHGVSASFTIYKGAFAAAQDGSAGVRRLLSLQPGRQRRYANVQGINCLR